MNKLLLTALALPLLVGCGLRGSSYRTGRVVQQPTGVVLDPGVPAGTVNYLIDAGAGVDSPLGTFAITTNGNDWIMGWQGDGLAHRFTGDVYCPVGCTFEYAVFDNLMLGDRVSTIANNHVGFDAVTDHTVRQQLTFGAPLQPITFNLFIDGQPAAAVSPEYATVYFPSGGLVGYADRMPFNLVSDNASALAVGSADFAPEAEIKAGTQTVSFSAPKPRKSGEVVTASTQQAGQ
jgi:hypothetical protein